MFPLLTILYILALPISLSHNPNEGRVAEPEVKAAMQYHGILFSEGTESGELIFYRKGKKCPLFTDSFKRANKKKTGISL